MNRRVVLIVMTGLIAGVAAVAAPETRATALGNPYGRVRTELSGGWRYIVDPLQSGRVTDKGTRYPFPLDIKQQPGGTLVEFDWDQQASIAVPRDWNSQIDALAFYTGLVWYRRTFDIFPEEGRRYFLYFEAADYHTAVYLNGEKTGEHEGGFTPFAFEITDRVQEGRNSLVVGVDNTHTPDTIPEVAYDWWNYGGITRPVHIVEVPETYIHDFWIAYRANNGGLLTGSLSLDGTQRANTEVRIEIPELSIAATVHTGDDGTATFEIPPPSIELWSPEHPRLYTVTVSSALDSISDQIGFRTVATRGHDILLNGEPLFLRGISIHEEPIGPVGRRGLDWETAEQLLGLARDELGCNFVRLAHYPHSEKMTRLADRLGLLVWSEVPVYWAIAYSNERTRELAVNMVTENVMRDRNRASIVVWSVANETPINDERNAFLGAMIDRVRTLDPTRLVSAALDSTTKEGDRIIVDDPLGERLDLLAVNEYEGWYGSRSVDDIIDLRWETPYDKPMIFSEFGAGAMFGFHGPKHERWTEEYQEYFYQQTLKMSESIPFLRGASPWILKDFRSPRRFHGVYQNFWNRKGVVSEKGEKKLAFFVLRDWYAAIKAREGDTRAISRNADEVSDARPDAGRIPE
jgi:beta-glucuronidase